jgi:hypothetical protein
MFVIKCKDKYLKWNNRGRIEHVDKENARKFNSESIVQFFINDLKKSNYHDLSYEKAE